MNNIKNNSVDVTSLKTKGINRVSVFVITSLLLVSMINSAPALAEDDFKDEIKVNVIESSSYDGCPYFGETVLEVKYQLASAEFALLVLEGSNDNSSFYQISSKEIAIGRGSSLLTFDAGECLQNVQVTFQ